MIISTLSTILENLTTKLNQAKPPSKRDPLSLEFKNNPDITIGVELEMQILDQNTLQLTDRSDELIRTLKAAGYSHFVPEMFKSIIEMNSSPHAQVQSLDEEIQRLIGQMLSHARTMGCELMGTGCHPFMHFDEMATRSGKRYKMLIERNQWLMRRWMVCGMHIHLGMSSANDCIRFMIFFEHFLPHLLAFSSSSPFWQGLDTGLHSSRATISEALPTSALLYTINSWSDLSDLVDKLVKSKTITHLKDLHWDIRPSPGYGTLEIRIFDMPSNAQDIAAIAALVHTLAIWFSRNGDWLAQVPKPAMWMARENKWRAMRYGLEAQIIKSTEGETLSLRDDCNRLFDRVGPIIREFGYQDYFVHLERLFDLGTSSDRQRKIMEQGGTFEEVIRHSIRELAEGTPIPTIQQAEQLTGN